MTIFWPSLKLWVGTGEFCIGGGCRGRNRCWREVVQLGRELCQEQVSPGVSSQRFCPVAPAVGRWAACSLGPCPRDWRKLSLEANCSQKVWLWCPLATEVQWLTCQTKRFFGKRLKGGGNYKDEESGKENGRNFGRRDREESLEGKGDLVIK